MKKGLFSLLGIVAFVALALMPATSFAAPSTGTAQSHKVHIFHSRGHAQLSRAASTSTTGNVTYHGGPVMAGPTNVYAIFWEPTGSSVSANYNSLIVRYFNDVGGSPLYKINSQYNQTDGTFPTNAVLAGTFPDTASPYPPSPLLDSDIQTEVTHAQTVNGWSSNIDNVFFVFIGKNVSLCTDSTHTVCTPDLTSPSNSFCAYHNFFGTNTIYAAIPYAASPNFNGLCNTGASPNIDDADQTINVTSHEQMEAATDPLFTGWHDSSNFEIGDLCAFTFGPGNPQGADVLWNKNPYIVQEEWSDNTINGCTLTTNTTINTAHTYYQIVNRNSGLVMDVSGGSTNAGAQVIQWTNHSGLNQQWSLVPDGNNYQIKNRNSGLVLDVFGGSKNAGANVIQWTNHNGLNQQWFLVPDGGYDLIVNVNSFLVADVSGGSTNAGAHVIQWTFHNGLNQQWELVPVSPFEIVNRNSNLLADVSGGSTSAGAHVIQWPFNNGLNQQWILVSDGAYYQIVNVKSKLVMDVSGGGTNAGAQVIQWTNHNGLNQQWSLVVDGDFFQIKNRNSGLVMDVFGASKNGGANVIQWTNHNGLNQQWSLVPTLA